MVPISAATPTGTATPTAIGTVDDELESFVHWFELQVYPELQLQLVAVFALIALSMIVQSIVHVPEFNVYPDLHTHVPPLSTAFIAEQF